jgi:lipid-A-disaccharide synthase
VSVRVEYDDSRRVVFESDIVLTASGTATLETGIIGRPMVVMYRTGFLTYQIARRLVTLDKIALVNLVLGEKAVPELVQNEAGPGALADQLARYWDDAVYRAEVIEKLRRVPELLGGPGASVNAAAIIEEYL